MNNPLMRVVFSLIGLFLVFYPLNAQKADSLFNAYRPIVALKFVPLPLIGRTPAIQFALEVKTFRHQSVQLEYGYVTDLYHTTKAGFYGFKLKTEYRVYNPTPYKILYNTFLGVQYMRKQVNGQGSVLVWRNDLTYQEFISTRISNKTNSFYFVSGGVFHFFGPLYFEAMSGLGLRILEVSYLDLPDDAVFIGGPSMNFFNPVNGEGTYYLLGVNVSIKIIYPFFKKL